MRRVGYYGLRVKRRRDTDWGEIGVFRCDIEMLCWVVYDMGIVISIGYEGGVGRNF